MGFVLKGNHFYEKLVCVSTPASFFYSMPILFRWLQTGICQSLLEVWKCSSIKIKGF